MKLLLITIVVFTCCYCFGQKIGKQTPTSSKKNERDTLNKYIQFSGVVLSNSDSLKPIPLTSVLIKNSRYGAISDYFGFFTLVAKPGDIIEFISIGFKDAQYKIPDTLSAISYSIIQTLFRDTIQLNTVNVFPWPSREDFKREFLNLNLPDDDIVRAERNMQAEDMRLLIKGLGADAQLSFTNLQNIQQTQLYHHNQMPTSNILNPVAWAKFIQAWRAGKFKKQKK